MVASSTAKTSCLSTAVSGPHQTILYKSSYRMIGDFVHRSNMVSRLLIAASCAVPASALAQPLEGNPLMGRQTAMALRAPGHW
jgi:hypothetical protein